MGALALTIEGSTSSPEDVLRRLDSALGRVREPSVVLLFAIGKLAAKLEALARGFAVRHRGLLLVVAGAESGFTERGELDAKDGYVGLIHGGCRVGLALYDDENEPFEASTRESSTERPAEPAAREEPLTRVGGPSLVLLSKVPSRAARHGHISVGEEALGWFGAVTTHDGPIWAVQKNGRARSAAAVRVDFGTLQAPLLMGASCCRLVSEPFTVTAVAGTTLLELDRMPALAALGKVTSRIAERSWIVLGLVPESSVSASGTADDGLGSLACAIADEARSVVFRPLRGVDPARGALVLRESLSTGARVAFAVRDDRTARRALDDGLRRVKQRLSGSIARFGLYFEGVGRGQQLFGTPNVELSQVRQNLGEFPLLGCRSTHELRQQDRGISIGSMSGQLALFRNPS